MENLILQSEILTQTSNRLLDYGVLGILVVIMGVAITIVARYFSKQVGVERDKNEKKDEKLIELIEKHINTNNEMIRLYEKGFSAIDNKLEIINSKIK